MDGRVLIQVRRRLVHGQKLRPRSEGRCDGDLLLLSARKAVIGNLPQAVKGKRGDGLIGRRHDPLVIVAEVLAGEGDLSCELT